MRDRIVTVDLTEWTAPSSLGQRDVAQALEDGKVLYFPNLHFSLEEEENDFLSPRWGDGRAKNISYDGESGVLKGARGDPASLAKLQAMVARFRAQAIELVASLFPRYAADLRIGRTSFRAARVECRKTSWRKDDTRLHAGAFSSCPSGGERILRLFTNINRSGEARVWRAGERFDRPAQRTAPEIRRPDPGSAAILRAVRATKSRRTEYDHFMLRLHGAMKAGPAYQSDSPQVTFAFPAGATWLCFPDRMPHAAMSGRYMCEQTLHIPVFGLHRPETAPLKSLERLLGRALV